MQAAATQARRGASRSRAPALRQPCCRRTSSCSSRPCTPHGGAGCTEGRRRRHRSCPAPRCPSCPACRAPAARRFARRRTCRRGRLRARQCPAAPRPSHRRGTARAQRARTRSRGPRCRSLGAGQARRRPWRPARRAGAGPCRPRWGPRARRTRGARMLAGPGGTRMAPAGRGGASTSRMRPCCSSRTGACRRAGRNRSGPLLPGCKLASAALPPAALKRAWNAAARPHRAFEKKLPALAKAARKESQPCRPWACCQRHASVRWQPHEPVDYQGVLRCMPKA